MATFFRKPDRRQRFLLPVDMQDWLPESDFVHLVLDAVEQMDLSGFEAEYRTGGAGQAPFAPAMMLAVLIYAYANGHRSSRKVERLCWRDVGFRMIVGDHVPDHSVLARFRRRHAERVQVVFVAVLRLCRAAGLGRLGVVALDGTKVAANAALAANRTAKTIDEEVAAILGEAEATDAAEDALHGELRGDELPAELRHRDDRLARLLAAKERWPAKPPSGPQPSRRRSMPAPPRRPRPASAGGVASRPRRRPRWTRRPRRTPPIPTAGS